MTQTSTAIEPVTSVDAVRQRLAYIASLARQGDFEDATVVERALWEGVLEAVAGCNAQAGWIAAEALKSREIDFPRWAA
jgi:hypothetical protein